MGFLTQAGLQSSTIRSYVSAIKASLRLIDYEWDVSNAEIISLTRACKLKNDVFKARLPIRLKLLHLLVFELERLYNAQFYLMMLYKSMFLVAYHGLLRIGEIAVGTHSIRATNVHESTNRNRQRLVFVLYSSKTHGRGQRPQTIKLISHTAGNDRCCPVKITANYMQLRGGYTEPNENFFIFRDGTPVKPKHVRAVLRQLLQRLGLNPLMYDTHSFRIGHATDLRADGVNIEKIKALGRWRSNAVYRYLK